MMHERKVCLALALCIAVLPGVLCAASAQAEEPSVQPAAEDTDAGEALWMKPLPVPFDVELEQQIVEVQDALKTIHQQMVRRKEAVKKVREPAMKTRLYEELEQLRKTRDELEHLLHELVEEAAISQKTEIDEALARARWLERKQEYEAQKEELIRDRQE